MNTTLASVLKQVRLLRAEVQRMADLMQKREDRREYQAAYYKKRKVAKKPRQLPGLSNLDRHCLMGARDTRMPTQEWGETMQRFARSGRSAYNFLTWLAWSWNKDTFQHVPITKSGGYLHLFIGLSAGKPLRQKYTDRDLMGQMKLYRFTKKEQLEYFRDAKWWLWGFHVLGSVVFDVDDAPWFKELPDDWVKPLRLMMGMFGEYEVRPGLIFDPNEPDLHKASRMVGLVRPTLEMCWAACRKGLHSSEEPFKANSS
jgi:hypothetical protein